MGQAVARITSSPNDPIFALVTYLLVALGLLAVLAGARTAVERAVRLLFLYLAYGTLEVAAKRLTHYAWYIYPIKFGLVLAVLIAWLIARPALKESSAKTRVPVVLLMYIVLAAVQIFNPNQPTPLVGVLGWMTEFTYIVFYFVAFDLLRDERSVRRLMWVTAALGVVSAISCLLELWIGPAQLQQTFPAYVSLDVFADGVGNYYRPSSLVPFIEIFGIACMVGLLAIRRAWTPILYVGIAFCVAATLFHAIRISWVVGVVFLVAFTALGQRRTWLGNVVVASLVFSSIYVLDLGNSLVGGNLASMATPVRTFQGTRLEGVLALPQILSAYPFGLGVGEGSPGLRFLETRAGGTRLGTHNYLTDLAGQMSLLGPLLLLAFGIGIVWQGIRVLRRPHQSTERMIAIQTCLALFGALLITLFGGNGLGAYPVNDYFWLTAGSIAAFSTQIKRLERPQRIVGRLDRRPLQSRRLRIIGRRAAV